MHRFLSRGDDAYEYERDLLLQHWDFLRGTIAGKVMPPIYGEIEPTDACNKQCKRCFFRNVLGQGRRLDRATMLTTVDQLHAYGAKRIWFSGLGEPLLNRHTVEAMERAIEHSMDLELYTNGICLTRRVRDVLLRAGRGSIVRVSIDAIHDQTFNILSPGSGSALSGKIMPNMRALCAQKKRSGSNVTILASFLVQPENIGEMEEFVIAMKGMGVDIVQFKFPVPGDQVIEANRIPALLKELTEIGARHQAKGFRVTVAETEEQLTQNKGVRGTSFMEYSTVWMRPDGKLYPQTYAAFDESLAIGDRRVQSLRDIWESAKRQQVLSRLRPTDSDHVRYDVLVDPFFSWLRDEYARSGERFLDWVELNYVLPLRANMRGPILITGASGSVGNGMFRRMSGCGVDLYGTWSSNRPERTNEERWRNLDVTDRQAVLDLIRETKPGVVIHCAALLTAASEKEPARATRINVEGTRNIAEACKRYNVKLIFLSTNHVFDGTKGAPYTEEDIPNPVNHYGRTKQEAEIAIREVMGEAGNWVVARIPYVVGDDQTLTRIYKNTLQRYGTVQIPADTTTAPTHIAGLTEVLLRLIGQDARGLYHVAGSVPMSQYTAAKMQALAAGMDPAMIVPVSFRPIVERTGVDRPQYSALSSIHADVRSPRLDMPEAPILPRDDENVTAGLLDRLAIDGMDRLRIGGVIDIILSFYDTFKRGHGTANTPAEIAALNERLNNLSLDHLTVDDGRCWGFVSDPAGIVQIAFWDRNWQSVVFVPDSLVGERDLSGGSYDLFRYEQCAAFVTKWDRTGPQNSAMIQRAREARERIKAQHKGPIVAFLGSTRTLGKNGVEIKNAVRRAVEKLALSNEDSVVLNGGFNEGVPSFSTADARRMGLSVISVMPRVGLYKQVASDEIIVVGEDWGDETWFLTQLADAVIIFQGGPWTSLEYEIAQRKGIPVVSVRGSGGVGNITVPYENRVSDGWDAIVHILQALDQTSESPERRGVGRGAANPAAFSVLRPIARRERNRHDMRSGQLLLRGARTGYGHSVKMGPEIGWEGKANCGLFNITLRLTAGIGCRLPQETITRILRIASWQDFSPDLVSGRRSAVIRLPKPLVIDRAGGQVVIRALQIKAVCYRPEEKGPAGPPRREQYTGAQDHDLPDVFFYFDQGGTSHLLPLHMRFQGPELLDNAKQELVETDDRFWHEGNDVAACGFIEFDPADFGGLSMGADILGLTDEDNDRLVDNVLKATVRDLHAAGITHIETVNDLTKLISIDRISRTLSDVVPRVSDIRRILKKNFELAYWGYGDTVRKMRAHGQPHGDNVSLGRAITFHDFGDNWGGRGEITPERRLGYKVGDIIKAVGSTRMNLQAGNFLFSCEQFCGSEIMKALVGGCFSDQQAGFTDADRIEQFHRKLAYESPLDMETLRDPVLDLLRADIAREPFRVSGVEIAVAGVTADEYFRIARSVIAERAACRYLARAGVARVEFSVLGAGVHKPKISYSLSQNVLSIGLVPGTSAADQAGRLMRRAYDLILQSKDEKKEEFLDHLCDTAELDQILEEHEPGQAVFAPLCQLIFAMEYAARERLDRNGCLALSTVLARHKIADDDLADLLCVSHACTTNEMALLAIRYARSHPNLFDEAVEALDDTVAARGYRDEELAQGISELWARVTYYRMNDRFEDGRLNEACAALLGVRDAATLTELSRYQLYNQLALTISPAQALWLKAVQYAGIPGEKSNKAYMFGALTPGELRVCESLSDKKNRLRGLLDARRQYDAGNTAETLRLLRCCCGGLSDPATATVTATMIVHTFGVEETARLLTGGGTLDLLYFILANYRPLDISDQPAYLEQTRTDGRYAEFRAHVGGLCDAALGRTLLPLLQTIPGRKSAELLFPDDSEMPEALVRQIQRVVTTNFRELVPGLDYDLHEGRSVYINVERILGHPFVLFGRAVRLIKLKGTCFNADDPLEPFTARPLNPLIFTFNGEGLMVRQVKPPLKPTNAMTRETADSEFGAHDRGMRNDAPTACALGEAMHTSAMQYQGNTLAVPILGIEDEGEMSFAHAFSEMTGRLERLDFDRFLYWYNGIKASGNRELVCEFVRQAGRSYRRAQDAGIIQNTYGLSNTVSKPFGGTRLSDLEYSTLLEGPTRRQEIAYRLNEVIQFVSSCEGFFSTALADLRAVGIDMGVEFVRGYLGEYAQPGWEASCTVKGIEAIQEQMQHRNPAVESTPLYRSLDRLVVAHQQARDGAAYKKAVLVQCDMQKIGPAPVPVRGDLDILFSVPDPLVIYNALSAIVCSPDAIETLAAGGVRHLYLHLNPGGSQPRINHVIGGISGFTFTLAAQCPYGYDQQTDAL
ncbi:MAG: sugar nucleotide-binding protein, partial [Candidatus Omnitrophota bacterium]